MNYQPSNALNAQLNRFVAFIAPDPDKREKIKQQSSDIREVITRQAEEDGLVIKTAITAGSFAKKTGLRRHLQGASEVEGQDIDIAFIVSPRDRSGRPLGCLIPRFEDYLRRSYPDSEVGQSKSSATIAFSASKLQFDAVPLFETNKQQVQRLLRMDGEVRQSSVQRQTEFMRSRLRASKTQQGSVAFNECVRLFKWWRYQRQTESYILSNEAGARKVPSFLLDLLCAKAFDTVGVSGDYLTTLQRWFQCLSGWVESRRTILFDDFINYHQQRAIAAWHVIDPMDDRNNVVKNWSWREIDELARWLRQSELWLNQVIEQDRRGEDVMNLLIKVFGPAFKTHAS